MKYFNKNEFACRCCGRVILDPDLCDMLDEARAKAKVAFHITSGYRCPTYNISIGGRKNSAHIHGMAADIRTLSSAERFAILEGLLSAGFHRIGIGPDFIHADCDESKPEGVLWTYYGS
jgi:hypothetical protein